MTWWAWMILGAVLFGAELFAIDAQFYLVFLGLSAAIVGLMSLVGIAMPGLRYVNDPNAGRVAGFRSTRADLDVHFQEVPVREDPRRRAGVSLRRGR